MDHENFRSKQRIVKEELEQLEEAQYISSEVSQQVVEAHDRYYADLKQQEAEKERGEMAIQEEEQSPEIPETKPVKQKKTLSAKEVRDRNITWSLNLGVVLLLIGGLVLATSTWETLANWMKSGSIALVSLLFFGLAVFTMRILKIEKTAFAFYVLGGLFLPITILSVGYFELLGSYFSFAGDGRYLFGAAGSLIILPIYLQLADKLSSRLFVWFSYITVTVLAGFLLAALYLPADGFYLGIMLFNAFLLFIYSRLRDNQRIELFMKEFVPYIQCSMILSTLLMLIFYNHELLYGFNLLITAILYFAMIYVAEHKEYSFVFSAMLVYGAYQLIEFSAVEETGPIVYALLGFVFLTIPKVIDDDHALKRIFRYTSAVVSACAFLYISFEGLVLRMNELSVIMLLAYVLIALNFAFLTNMTKRRLFAYLSPVFLMSAFYEMALFSREWFGYDGLMLPLFVMGLILYGVFGCLIKTPFFQRMKASSRDVGGIVMLLAVLADFVVMNLWQTGTMLLLISITALLTARYEGRIVLAKSATWIHAASLGLSVMMFYAAADGGSAIYDNNPFQAESFVLAGLVVLLASFGWQRVNQTVFAEHAFFAAFGFYGLGMWQAFSFDVDAVMRAVIMLGGVAMAYLLYRKTKWMAVTYVVSGISLLLYITALIALHSEMGIESELFQSLQFVLGALLLLAAGVLAGKYDANLRKSFGWAGHLFLPLALLVSLLFFEETTVWAFFMAAVVYAISLRFVQAEWLVLSFLYGCFTAVWIGMVQWFVLLELAEPIPYAALLTSIMLAVGWYVSQPAWTRRMAFYVVPFSVFGMFLFTLVPDFDGTLFGVTLLYAVVTLFMMHQEQWNLFSVFPLVLVYRVLWLYDGAVLSPEYVMQFRLVVFAGVLLAAGLLMYTVVYQEQRNRDIPVKLDWYSVVGFAALLSLYDVPAEALWAKLLPGLLVSLFVVLQRKRMPYVPAKWAVFGACVYLLEPYYVLLGNLQTPDLIERELYVLPWVAAVIFLKVVSGRKYTRLVNYIQWAILVIVSLLLIQDGLASSTIYDALIVGGLSLASMLGGMIYQRKAFFFVGAGVLLLNVFLQTQDYWGNLPWWAYLLIAGSILIAVASYNEWHKQKTADGKTTMASKFYQNVLQKIKRWE
ncbi:hypothetical protein [Lentibacillus amyloliquefaciens]|uniref:DUF2157 domain-containing protein n=1 Tax=Lentibacillus amyloliquefaciens TaxID=1472767 RepID=A0A0U4DXN3_9BACI|nr:hypothetical protein [Lentibacillus amyloliquefaciens]ALX50136.1 hypothetical protein AOX59_17060 [Lentibacillus amyloliquefaciens]